MLISKPPESGLGTSPLDPRLWEPYWGQARRVVLFLTDGLGWRLFNEIMAEDDEAAQAADARVVPAAPADWDTEYLAPVLAIRVVKDMDEAIEHIVRHSSQHTDSIVTENYTRARRFLREVDSSSVMVNASTRFADGFEYGLGAEIGISTDKIHARGPVGLKGLTSQKYIVFGDGHIRQ